MMTKRIISLCAALLLCAVLALSASLTVLAATYPAGIDESLTRVDDGASLLASGQAESLNTRARALAQQYHMDIVIVTRQGIGGKTPTAFADDYFDYGGYGWRGEDEAGDITTGSGILLLIEMNERDVLISTKGKGQFVFRDGVWEQMITAIKPQLKSGDYAGAFGRFLDEAESRLKAYEAREGIYADPEPTYNQGHYNENGSYVYDGETTGAGPAFNGGVFVFSLIVALLAAWIVVASMKKKHNTIRLAAAAANYQHGFSLTERQDIFLYSNTSRVRIETESSSSGSSGGGGFSGGGSHTSSSGSSHGGGGSKF